jgi:hypothetical protein
MQLEAMGEVRGLYGRSSGRELNEQDQDHNQEQLDEDSGKVLRCYWSILHSSVVIDAKPIGSSRRFLQHICQLT